MSAGRLGTSVALLTHVALAAEHLVAEHRTAGVPPDVDATTTQSWDELHQALSEWRANRGAR